MAVEMQVGLLTLKTAAKPLAKQFEVQVMSHPVARKKVIDLAQVCAGMVPWHQPAACSASRILPSSLPAACLPLLTAPLPPAPTTAVAARAGGGHQPRRRGQVGQSVCGEHD